MKWRFVRGVPGDQVIREVVVDVARSLIVFAVAFGGILLLERAAPGLAVFGRWAFVLAAAVLAIRFFLGCLFGLADSVLEGSEGGGWEGSGWILFVTGSRALELGLVLWMAFFLFRNSG